MDYLDDHGTFAGPPSVQDVATFYDRKTEAILKRYGPGPRVHFHAGFGEGPPCIASVTELRSQLVVAQERMMQYAARAWQLRSVRFRDVLDVGCGLGGSAIFWAQEFGAKVTAVTTAPSHIEIIRRFAAQAAVDFLVRPLLSDAAAVPGESCFDAATAIDSANSFPRRPWFRRLAGLLRPGGQVFIFDCLVERPEYREPIDRHWCAQVGTMDEYLAAADEAGFTPKMVEDVSIRVADFWTTTVALIKAEMKERTLDPAERVRLDESLRVHALVRQGCFDRGLTYALMSFVRTSG
jgi:SAM-dependent methyltransferase